MEEVSDAELVGLVAQGGVAGRAAEGVLCRRFGERVLLYGFRHLRDDERARDLVQSVLLAVLEAARASRIDDPSKLDRFVLGTCRNTVSKIRERSSRVRPLDDALLATLAVEPVERVDAAALVACVDALEARAKQVVMLAFVEDRSAEDIATVLSTTAGNVRVLRHRALGALRRCLDAPKEVRG